MAKIIICNKCGRKRKHQAKGMCASCYVREYKKKNNYEGPVRKCIDCGKEKPIHSNDRCRLCYNSWYRINNIKSIKERKAKFLKENPEEIKEQQRRYREKNKDKLKENWQKYYNKNKDILSEKSKAKYNQTKKLEIEKKIDENIDLTLGYEEKIQDILNEIPDMKRALIKEFLTSTYANRSYHTKIKLLLDIKRLLNYIKRYSSNKYYGSWNILEVMDIELCQTETGMLKDSLRIFFKWLVKRKRILVDLSEGIPVATANTRVSKIPLAMIKDLYNKWNNKNCDLEERIAGLFIIYYGLSNRELRLLKDDDIIDNSIRIRHELLELDNKLKGFIKQYKELKKKKFCEVKTEYFFTTIYSIKKNSPVSISYFSKLFKRKNTGVTPSEIRKTMIYFHKNSNQADPFFISSLFGITPRGAARYF